MRRHFLFPTANLLRSVLAVLCTTMFVAGCSAPAHRVHPGFQQYRQGMHTLLIPPPEIRILETLPDGSRLPMTDRSRQAAERTQALVEQALHDDHFAVRTLSPQMQQQPAYAQVKALFRAVNRSIQLHVFGPQPFPAKQRDFAYQLGSVTDLLQAAGADGLLLISGYQSEAQPSPGWLSIAVVEPGGRVIWYGWRRPHRPIDFQNADDLSSLISAIMADFWVADS